MGRIKGILYPLLQKCSRIVFIMLYRVNTLIFKSKEKRILIASNTKTELYGNLLYVYEELKKYNYEIKLLLMDKANAIEKLKYYMKLFHYVATSKYILIDDFFPEMYALKIRKGSKFIQVWHALGAYKRVGYARNDIGNRKSISHKNYTDTIVSSDSIVENYAEAFGISKDKVHPLGVPRTDMFFDKKKIETKRKNIYQKYEVLKNKRVILFAPTFRGKGRKSAYYPEEYINLDTIYLNLKADEVFLIKLHPFIKNKIKIKESYKDKILDFTSYNDINELLLVTDLLITDYSSVIFEYSLMKKPILFYVPDLEEYANSRSFFYDYNEYMYGVTVKNETELIEGIKNASVDVEKLSKFTEKFLNRCDGKSSKRFVEELILK